MINNSSIKNSPVKDVFRIAIPMAKEDSAGRMSWDETAVLVGVLGYQPWYKLQSGRIIINEDGSNEWTRVGLAHAHLVENTPSVEVQNLINKLIMHQPR